MRFLLVVTYLVWLFACGRMRCGLCFLITFVPRVVCVLLLFSLLLFDFGFRCGAIWVVSCVCLVMVFAVRVGAVVNSVV